MIPRSARNDIEQWILSELKPSRSTTAEIIYERMESQSGEQLAVIYEPLDYRKRSHWHDVAICAAFAHAVRGARTVLDVGPGDGWPSLRIADRFDRVVGIDPSPRRVRVQKENAERLGITNVEFLEMDVDAMTFEDASFGGVTAASSIEQTDDPEKALREVLRVLEPGGALAMVFEDYATYFPESDGDEGLWIDTAGEEPVLFYQVRAKSPPRETWYALFLDGPALGGDAELSRIGESLSQDRQKLENLEHGHEAPMRPEWFDIGFFERLAPLTREAKYFDLGHLTSDTLDAILGDVGFVDARHLDYRIPELRSFFDSAEESGKLDGFARSFESISELFGIAAIRRAGFGPGGFVIARKPGQAGP